MDPPKDLLLSEGVCWQLGILTYHPKVQPLRSEQTDDKTVESEMSELQTAWL